MSIEKKWQAARTILFAIFGVALLTPSFALAQLKQPLLSEDNLKRVSDHVYVIEGFPNVAIIIGSRATMVVDTGLGQKNGATVMRAEQKLAKGSILYLTTTHFHSEHTSGEQAFPASTIIIRNSAQQDEMNKGVAGHIEVFKKMSAQNLDLLQDVKFRAPDVVFDRESKVDLGGVTARLFWLGPAHTKGDELIFVEEDSVLIPGDIVQKDIFPIMPNPDASVKGWLSILDNVEALHPKFIVPDHGPAIVDASQIATERAYLMALQSRALELKKQGVSVDDAGKTITTELKVKNPDWPNPNNVAGEVARVYEQSQ
ncbi:MAG TPA: MBL fold metallo-hydrolase [Candidatus Saccharimonadales bacterium]|jgi:glyoxylase-like metal-dependent hydrolase (beta-lactamase superfamily II)|nr:MBL fold metallo-hydrolase [Candidatus Saccharimonadales bacterium]